MIIGTIFVVTITVRLDLHEECAGTRVTKMDKIRNERIRGATKVGEIAKNVQERRLKWYGHTHTQRLNYGGRWK